MGSDGADMQRAHERAMADLSSRHVPRRESMHEVVMEAFPSARLDNMGLPEPVLEICGIEYVVSLTHRSLCGCLVRQVLLTAYPRCPPRLSRESGPCKMLCKT